MDDGIEPEVINMVRSGQIKVIQNEVVIDPRAYPKLLLAAWQSHKDFTELMETLRHVLGDLNKEQCQLLLLEALFGATDLRQVMIDHLKKLIAKKYSHLIKQGDSDVRH